MQKAFGFDKYLIGNYPTKGCFAKGGTAYFGIGGNNQDKKAYPLSGLKQRIFCDIEQNDHIELANIGTSNARPTPKPSPKPSVPGFELPNNNLGKNCIDIEIKTSKYGQEKAFSLTTLKGSAPNTLLDYPVNSLKSNSTTKKRVCVPKGTYILAVEGRATFTASLDGEEVLFGNNFLNKKTSYDIVAGYSPAMSKQDEAWLKEHNTRRDTFHKKYNTEYRPLHWSSELAKDASNWIDKILPTCEIVRENDLVEGENISIGKYSGHSGANNETPAHILARWSDQKKDKDYPQNQSHTQVNWRSTRHVGCDDKAARMNDGSYCHVSICRYSRPGNCGMRSYAGNWLKATLEDRTWCGNVCPKEGCH